MGSIVEILGKVVRLEVEPRESAVGRHDVQVEMARAEVLDLRIRLKTGKMRHNIAGLFPNKALPNAEARLSVALSTAPIRKREIVVFDSIRIPLPPSHLSVDTLRIS